MRDQDESPLAAFEAAAAKLAALRTSSRENVQRATRLSADARSVRAVARSRREGVSVTAGAGGIVTDIELGEAAYDLSPQELGRTLVRTVAQAQHDAAVSLAEAAAQQFGVGSAVAAALLSEAEAAFPLIKEV